MLDPIIIRQVARTYNILDYHDQLYRYIAALYPDKDFTQHGKHDLHKIINDTLFEFYQGEEFIKYALFKKFFKHKLVAAFELKVNRSRADFLTINGSISNFEIKSKRDNLDKLPKQADDYISVFEYNYIVADPIHLDNLESIVPSSFGIWSFQQNRRKQWRAARPNRYVDPKSQLMLLTQKEISDNFDVGKGNIRKVLRYYSKNKINEQFKLILKNRYKRRWDFLVSHMSFILPIDIQFFFNTNVHPYNIYLH